MSGYTANAERSTVPCPPCGGTGYLQREDGSEERCSLCNGEGSTTRRRERAYFRRVLAEDLSTEDLDDEDLEMVAGHFAVSDETRAEAQEELNRRVAG